MVNKNRVRLELYAAKLRNVAGVFKGTSDPYAVVTLLANDPNEKPQVLGKTEVIKNSLNPKWTTSFDLDYEIGNLTRINIGIYDEVKKGTHTPMGSAMFEVGEVLASRGNIKAKNLRKGGTLYARITSAPDASTAASVGMLRLKLKGVGLSNVDGFFGKSDPFLEVNAKIDSAGGLSWQPVYRSKPVMNNLNPDWEEFSVDISRLCGGDLNRPVQVKVLDWQKNGQHTAMGSFETSVNGFLGAQATGAADTSKAFKILKRGRQVAGEVVVLTARVEGGANIPGYTPPHAAMTGTTATASMPATAASAPGGFSQSLQIPPSSKYVKINGVVKLNPEWKRYQEQQSGGAPATTVASPDAIALVSSMDDGTAALSSSAPVASNAPLYDLYGIAPLPPPMAPSAYTATTPAASGRPKFVDYLSGGCELNLCVAIDFTGSNGDPRRPGTLHYISPDGRELNDYEKAITAVGAIVARYDYDQKITAWGFGAKYGGVIQHCFQVGHQPELDGVQGVLEGYRNTFRSGLVMSGPTVFTEVIGMAAGRGRREQEHHRRIGKQAYTVLLILTDGAVSDVESTKQAIAAACDAPLSIVIVGIGQADFSAMRFLDEFQHGGAQGRDICKFVEFSRFKDDRRALTRTTLEEIPDQLVDYFYSRGIMPLPPVHGSQMSLDIEESGEEDIDLNMNFGPEGEISLANYDGAVYDDTKYGTPTTGFAPSAPLGSPYRPHVSQHSQPLQSQAARPPPFFSASSGGGQQSSQPYQSQPYQPAQPPQAFSSSLGGGQQSIQSQPAQPPPFSQALGSSLGGGQQSSQQYQYQSQQYQPAKPASLSQAFGSILGAAQQYAGGKLPSQSSGQQQQYGGAPPSQATSTPQARIFHVKAPPNSYPGMQLQVQNPVNGQQMIVSVPQGVAPGELFGVRY